MKLTIAHRQCLLRVLIVSLIACALMPLSTALFSAGQSACHSLGVSHSSHDDGEMHTVFTASPHQSTASEHEHLCDEDPVPLPAELTPLHIGWWTVLVLLSVLPLRQLAMHTVWRRGSRPRSAALRSHLAIGRIHV